METLYSLIREGTIFALYQDFLQTIKSNDLENLVYNTMSIDKIGADIVKVYYVYGIQPDPYPLIISKKELFKITDIVMYLMNKDWQEIYIEFDGTFFSIQVDGKEYNHENIREL